MSTFYDYLLFSVPNDTTMGGMETGDRAINARRAWTNIVHLFISENHRRSEIADDLDITVADLITLFRLQPGSAPPQRDLAEQWACDASWVTAKVDQLESLGLVQRRPNPDDRRSKTVVLTAAGERTREKALDRFYGPPSAFAALSDAEVKRLAELLAKLEVPDPAGGGRNQLTGWLERKLDKAEAKVANAQGKVTKARQKLEAAPQKVSTKAQQKLVKAQERLGSP